MSYFKMYLGKNQFIHYTFKKKSISLEHSIYIYHIQQPEIHSMLQMPIFLFIKSHWSLRQRACKTFNQKCVAVLFGDWTVGMGPGSHEESITLNYGQSRKIHLSKFQVCEFSLLKGLKPLKGPWLGKEWQFLISLASFGWESSAR